MRLRISHKTTYLYAPPATRVIQVLRLTPRNHDGQYVAGWRIDVSPDCRLDQHEDAFGNITHTFAADGPLGELVLAVEGEIETRDTQGVVRDAVERFPPSLFLRETTLTACDEALAAFAATARLDPHDDALTILHRLLQNECALMEYDPEPAFEAATAAEALAHKRGRRQDLAHVFITAARCLGIPARYVGGYFVREDGEGDGHAWAEAFVGDLGWVAFDPANGLCATDAHVRVAVGLDHLGAAPVRGTRYGGGSEALSVSIRVDQASRQSQS